MPSRQRTFRSLWLGTTLPSSPALAEFALDTYLPYMLNLTGTKLCVLSSESYRERFGIGISEWRALATIAWNQKISVNAVSARTSLDTVAASRAVARLVKLGFVKSVTNKDDARLVMLTTTAAGRRVYNAITPQALALEEAIRAALGPAGHDRLRDLVLELRAALASGVIQDALAAPPKKRVKK
jgi:DNA-binding MarR family transcriptional regulator